MKKNIYRKIGTALLCTCIAITLSCKKVFDLTPKSVVDVSQHYRNIFDVNAAVIGIYGQMMGLAEQYIVLNELRADMMEVTVNSDQNLVDISQHNVKPGNPWADPRPFYKIIINCNDALYHMNIMLANHTISNDDYNQRYSDIGAIRSWLYLQLGIHFGAVPYVTDPVANIDDLKDDRKYAKLPFDQLLTRLISFMSTLPYLDPYGTPTFSNTNTSTSLITTADGYQTSYQFINKRILLGDLYLWQGKDFIAAATQYRIVMETQTNNPNINISLPTYKVAFGDLNSSGWRSIFTRAQDALYATEWIWAITFDSTYSPADPFVDLFSNQGGSYLAKPSQTAMNYWNSQVQPNGTPYDQRGPSSYRLINGQPVITKYLYYYLDQTSFIPTKLLKRNGKWFLYRAATLHLHFAEAANRVGRGKLAFALLNSGISNVFNGVYPNSITVTPLPSDVTNIEQTFDTPPFNFDARVGDYPNYRAPWYQNNGIRKRGGVTDLNFALSTDQQGLEDALILEDGLELGFEGNRWADLLRISLRRNDPSFIANKIADKLNSDGFTAAATTAKTKLLAGDYYLPFNW